MRWKVPAGALLVMALLMPATSALARTGSPAPAQAACRTVVYEDVRELVTIDVATASDTEVRLLANQVLAVAVAESLTTLPGRLQALLGGPAADLRACVGTGLLPMWSRDLRVAVNQTMVNAGSHVAAAGQAALDN